MYIFICKRNHCPVTLVFSLVPLLLLGFVFQLSLFTFHTGLHPATTVGGDSSASYFHLQLVVFSMLYFVWHPSQGWGFSLTV